MRDREIELIATAESIADTYTRSYPTETDDGAVLRGILHSNVAIARLLYNAQPEKTDDTKVSSVNLGEIPENIAKQMIILDDADRGVRVYCIECVSTIHIPSTDLYQIFKWVKNHVARNH